jgi:hypothetical protein
MLLGLSLKSLAFGLARLFFAPDPHCSGWIYGHRKACHFSGCRVGAGDIHERQLM